MNPRRPASEQPDNATPRSDPEGESALDLDQYPAEVLEAVLRILKTQERTSRHRNADGRSLGDS